MSNKLTKELTNTTEESHSWEFLTQAVQNFRSFYRTNRFSTVFSREPGLRFCPEKDQSSP